MTDHPTHPDPTPSPDADSHLPLRPVVKPALRRLWRDETELQLGAGAPHAVTLTDVDRERVRLLDRIDGRTTRAELLAAGAGPLLRELDRHDALDDATGTVTPPPGATDTARSRVRPDTLAWSLRGPAGHAVTVQHRRARAQVLVRGAGRVGALVAVLLTSAGVGRVEVVDPAALRAGDIPAPLTDLEPDEDGLGAPPTRADAARQWCDRLGTAAARTEGEPCTDRRAPDVVVLTPVSTCGAVDPLLHEGLVRDGVAHLPAYVRESTGVVGPFVLPGRGPCLRCVELSRADRDRAWPRVLAQLVAGPGPTATEPIDPCDGVLATLVAAHATLEVLTHLDGTQPSTCAASHHVHADDPLVQVRRWSVHPACGCGWGTGAEPSWGGR